MRVGALRGWYAIGLLILIGAIVHGQSVFVGLVADDFGLLRAASSSSVVHLLTDPFPAGRGTYFRPLVMVSLAISSQPFLQHLINLLAHLASGLLVFAISRTISISISRSGTPFVAALIFLVHPIVAYDVNWISGRTDSFACFFSLLVLYSALKDRPILAAASLLLALASKEVALSTPIAALALSIFLARSTKSLIGLGGIAVGWIVLLVARFYRAAEDVGQLSIGNALKGMASVPILFVWPNSFWEVRHLLLTYPVLLPLSALLLLVPLVLGLRWLARHRDQRRAVVALFVLATAPLLPLFLASLVPSTRLMYLPLATTCIALVGLRQIIGPSLPRQLIPISLIAIALMIVGSLLRGHRWIDNSRRIATYCEDFIALRRNAPPNTTPLLVTYPSELDDTPLFVHHTHSTLRACSSSEPNANVTDAMIVVGPIVMAHSASTAIVSVRRDPLDPKTLHLQITDGSSFFGFEVPLAMNTPLSFSEVTLVATQANNPREVRGLSTTFPPEIIATADLLYFDGDHLRRIPAP